MKIFKCEIVDGEIVVSGVEKVFKENLRYSGGSGGISPNSAIPPSGGGGGISAAEAAANLQKLTHRGCSTMDKTLRDEIAIEAMKVFMVMPIQELIDMYGHTSVSQAAYEQADSMLLARSKKEN